MILETLIVGPMAVNCYVLGCEKTRQAVVIDPGDQEQDILTSIHRHQLKVVYVLLSHGHVDHIGVAKELADITNCKIFIHPEDESLLTVAGLQATLLGLRPPSPFKTHHFNKDGDSLQIGEHEIAVLPTPGHSPGSVCFKAGPMLFSGDTLFCESVGRTDLPGGSAEKLQQSISRSLFTLAADTRVYPGHGPATTIGHEAQFNPFFHD